MKTDRRDAELLVRLLMAGALTQVSVPPPETERPRPRAPATGCGATSCAPGTASPSCSCATAASTRAAPGPVHRGWLAGQRFELAATELAYHDGLAAIEGLLARREALDRRLGRLALEEPFWPTVARLRCFRGIDTLSALALHLEVHDWRRFERAPQLAAWLGLTPSLAQSGQTSTHGAVTKTGSTYARRLLVEAAKHYARPPRGGAALARRQEGQPDHVLQTAWRAQQRLFRLQTRLRRRGKPANVATVAAARELACFLWSVATAD